MEESKKYCNGYIGTVTFMEKAIASRAAAFSATVRNGREEKCVSVFTV